MQSIGKLDTVKCMQVRNISFICHTVQYVYQSSNSFFHVYTTTLKTKIYTMSGLARGDLKSGLLHALALLES